MRERVDDAIWSIFCWMMSHVGLVCWTMAGIFAAALTPWFRPYLAPIFDATFMTLAWIILIGGFIAFFVFMTLYVFAVFSAPDMPPYGLDEWLKGGKK